MNPKTQTVNENGSNAAATEAASLDMKIKELKARKKEIPEQLKKANAKKAFGIRIGKRDADKYGYETIETDGQSNAIQIIAAAMEKGRELGVREIIVSLRGYGNK